MLNVMRMAYLYRTSKNFCEEEQMYGLVNCARTTFVWVYICCV